MCAARVSPSTFSRHSAGDRLHSHRHAEPYAALVLEGGYEEMSVDGVWPCEAGDLVLHPPFHRHANAFGGRGARVLNIPIPAALAARIAYGVFRPADTDRLLAGDPDALQGRLGPRREPGMAESWIDRFAAALAIDEAASVGALSQRFGVTHEHASRAFRRRFAMTPSQYRAEARLMRALGLLKTTAPLSAVAHQAGYADQAHFCRALRAATASTPSALRNRAP